MRSLICGLLALLITSQSYLPLMAQTACHFNVTIDQVPLYNAPLPHISQQIGILPQGAEYPVLKATPLYLDSLILVALEDNTEGWVLQRQGDMTGDCMRTPIEDIPITDYASVCTFTTSLIESMTVPAETPMTYAVIGFEDQRYLLWLDHAHSAWAESANGILGGACTTTPSATALENARLWTAPDVTTGQRVASVPLKTPLNILAGPVEGPIQFNSAVTGLWYRVSDEAGRMGWLWSARLDLGQTEEEGRD